MEILVHCLEEFDYDKEENILIGYTKYSENAELLVQKMKEKGIQRTEENMCELGSVIATHAGKNAFILCFVKNS